jgi:hypothetical protein
MSTGNSDQTENHWPGYVDALTTMLMVLTFVMMILGVAVFAMSQNVSRILIESIARAAQLDPPFEEVPVSELADRILDKLRRHPPRPPVRRGSEDAEERGRHDPGAGEGGAPESARLTSEAAAARPGDAAPVRTTTAGAAIVLEFRSRATQLDEATSNGLQALLSGSAALREAGRIDIMAVVDTASGSITDARRIAYYRAMLVRTAAIRAGMPAERLRLRLDEQGREPNANVVRVIGMTGAASPVRP